MNLFPLGMALPRSRMPLISASGTRSRNWQVASRNAPDLQCLVNNAGFGTIDYFVDTDAKYVVEMVDVHVVAPTILTRAVLPGMIARNRGAIINVSSMAAWFQSAGNVHYGAMKNFLAIFSMSLHQELRRTNVRVQALCPGFIRTEFHDAQSMNGFHLRCALVRHLWMTPEEVVNCSFRRLWGKQVIVIPGFWYRILGRLAEMPVLQPLMRHGWPKSPAGRSPLGRRSMLARACCC